MSGRDDMEALVGRIEAWMTDIGDAVAVARLLARAMRYESALREIAVYGSGATAMLAVRALAGEDARVRATAA